jgi:hypothetical protein
MLKENVVYHVLLDWIPLYEGQDSLEIQTSKIQKSFLVRMIHIAYREKLPFSLSVFLASLPVLV